MRHGPERSSSSILLKPMAQRALLTERRHWWSAFGSRCRYGLRPVPAERADHYGMMISTQDVLVPRAGQAIRTGLVGGPTRRQGSPRLIQAGRLPASTRRPIEQPGPVAWSWSDDRPFTECWYAPPVPLRAAPGRSLRRSLRRSRRSRRRPWLRHITRPARRAPLRWSIGGRHSRVGIGVAGRSRRRAHRWPWPRRETRRSEWRRDLLSGVR